MKEEKFPNSWKPSHQWVGGEFRMSEGNITGRKKKTKTQNRRLTATPSREAAQTLAAATLEQRLDREVWVACLG